MSRRNFYIDRVMPRKLAMYGRIPGSPLLRDVTILETVSPWKWTRAMRAAGELMSTRPYAATCRPGTAGRDEAPARNPHAAAPRALDEPVMGRRSR